MRTRYRLRPHVGLVCEQFAPPRVHLADLRRGPITTLPGSSAVILLVALELASDEIAQEVARLTEVDTETVRAPVAEHLALLVEQGFLEETPCR